MLRNAVLEAVEHARIDGVSEVLERLVEAHEHASVVPARKIRNVLDEYGTGPQVLHHGHEALPELRPRILGTAAPRGDKVPDHRTAGSRERLAGRPARDEVHVRDPPAVEITDQLGGLRKITDVPESTDVRLVRLHGVRVPVGPDRTEKPASRRPRLRPPAPLKRSIAVGRGALLTHLRTPVKVGGVRSDRRAGAAGGSPPVVGNGCPALPDLGRRHRPRAVATTRTLAARVTGNLDRQSAGADPSPKAILDRCRQRWASTH